MTARLTSFLFMLAGATDKELAQQVQFLKEENRILRARLPKKLTVTPQERRRLLRFGKPLGKAIVDLISIVSPFTFFRWLRRQKSSPAKPIAESKPGRPRTDEEIRALIVRLAQDNAWGYTRILGELRKLGVHTVSRSSIANILKEEGFDTAPKRGPGTWTEFIRRHAQTLYACDFFSKKVWTCQGLVEVFVFAVIHIGSRRVHIAGMTRNPDAAWMAQQARNLSLFFDEQHDQPRFLIRDLDGKYTAQFDAILESEGVEIVPVGPRAPNLNAFCERWMGSIKHECLNHFIVFGEAYLRHIISEYVSFYNTVRPHQGLGNNPLALADLTEDDELLPLSEVICRERLGGLLHDYRRAA